MTRTRTVAGVALQRDPDLGDYVVDAVDGATIFIDRVTYRGGGHGATFGWKARVPGQPWREVREKTLDAVVKKLIERGELR